MSQRTPSQPQQPQDSQQLSSQGQNSQQTHSSFKRNIIIALIGSPVLAAIVTGIFLFTNLLTSKGALSSPTPTPIGTTSVIAASTPTLTPTDTPTLTPSPTVSSQPTPQKTLQTLCKAAVNEDYQTQWDQFDLNYAEGNWGNESKFAADLMNRDIGHNGVTSCTVTNVRQNGSSASGTETETFNDSTTDSRTWRLLPEQGGVWKING